MTLPDYKNSLEYWTEMDKRYSCGLLYGFHLYENNILATVTDTLSNLPVFALTDIPYFSSFAQLYLFPKSQIKQISLSISKTFSNKLN